MARVFQRLKINKPLNSLDCGYDNNITSNISLTVGSNNNVNSPFSILVGNSNKLLGDNNNANSILGDNNRLIGGNNNVNGNDNFTNGNLLTVNGSYNNLSGDKSFVVGDYNLLINSNILLKDNYIVGNNNTINSSTTKIIGNNNNINVGASNSYIFGNNNTITNSIVVSDNSGNTESNFIRNYITTSENIYINGNTNTIGSASNNISITGNNNTIGASISNVFLFGDGITATNSNQFMIKSDVVIDGKLMPTDLIQDYVPINASDPYAPKGAMVKDDNNLYIRTTNTGWRSIHFNNSYGYFLSTATQSNPTASGINTFTYNHTQYNSNIFISDSSKLNVVFDGVYSIQFSAQLEKSDSGTDEIDIWLRYNGVDVEYSNTRITLQGNNAKTVASWGFIQAMTASSYCQLMWSSPDTTVSLLSIGSMSSPNRPGIPSIILTMDKMTSI